MIYSVHTHSATVRGYPSLVLCEAGIYTSCATLLRYTMKYPTRVTCMQVTSKIFHGIPFRRKRCLTILYYTIDNTVTSTIDGSYAWRKMNRLTVILWNKQRFSCTLTDCISPMAWRKIIYLMARTLCFNLFANE